MILIFYIILYTEHTNTNTDSRIWMRKPSSSFRKYLQTLWAPTAEVLREAVKLIVPENRCWSRIQQQRLSTDLLTSPNVTHHSWNCEGSSVKQLHAAARSSRTKWWDFSWAEAEDETLLQMHLLISRSSSFWGRHHHHRETFKTNSISSTSSWAVPSPWLPYVVS